MKLRARSPQGFTLIEILVVVTIVSILAGTVTFFALQGSQSSRDAKRQSDLRALQAAVEQYKVDHGRYPAGCRGADQWSGEAGTSFACSGGVNAYIVGLAPTYIARLPRDPRRSCNTECGYAYITNANGTVYKIMVMNTVESEEVTYAHPLKSCDITGRANNDIRFAGMCGRDCRTDPWCGSVTNAFTETSHRCNYTDLTADPGSNSRFERSYGVWGGFASLNATQSSSLYCYTGGRCVDERDPLNLFVGSPTTGQQQVLRMRAVYETTKIICK